MTERPVITVVFARLGPYHLARLRGAADVLSRHGVGLAAIAVASQDKTYAWDRVEDPTECPTEILFRNQGYEEIPVRQLERRMVEALGRFDPRAVALPGWAFAEARAGLAWCRHYKRAAILMSESSHGDHPRLWPRELMKQRLVRKFSSALVGGRRHAEYACSLGIPRAAIFRGYDAVDNDYFSRGADEVRRDAERWRSEHGLPARYLLTTSRFIRIKNIDGLLRGYALYRARQPEPADLVVCGDGEEREHLHRVACEVGVDRWVHWPGFVQYPKLPAYYALADAFVLASSVEPWGLVVNEAMACGLPVLVSNRCGCAPDLVQEGANGFTFDPARPEAIAEALLKLPKDAQALSRLGQRSKEIVEDWSPQAFGEGLLAAARLAVARQGREDFGPCGSLAR